MPPRPDVPRGHAPERRGPAGESFLESALAFCAAPSGHFDELLEAGAVRAHWRRFARHAGATSAQELGDVERQLARQLREDGATYTVYAAGDGAARPWALDMLPSILTAAEWEPIAGGLRQRARLLNAMAADFYGAQDLLATGLIPPALVLGHPGFLRACHGVVPQGGVYLHQVAF